MMIIRSSWVRTNGSCINSRESSWIAYQVKRRWKFCSINWLLDVYSVSFLVDLWHFDHKFHSSRLSKKPSILSKQICFLISSTVLISIFLSFNKHARMAASLLNVEATKCTNVFLIRISNISLVIAVSSERREYRRCKFSSRIRETFA